MSKKQKDAYAIAEISNILYEAYNTGGLGVEAGEVTSKAQAIQLKEDIHDLAIEAYPMLKSFFDNNNSTLKDAQDQLAAVYSHVEDMKEEVVNEKRRADELVDKLERVQKELDACLEMAPKKEEIIDKLERELRPYREEAHIPFSKYHKLEADLDTAYNANDNLHKELTLQGKNVDRLLTVLEKVVQ